MILRLCSLGTHTVGASEHLYFQMRDTSPSGRGWVRARVKNDFYKNNSAEEAMMVR
jgi:hypothetical protein